MIVDTGLYGIRVSDQLKSFWWASSDSVDKFVMGDWFAVPQYVSIDTAIRGSQF